MAPNMAHQPLKLVKLTNYSKHLTEAFNSILLPSEQEKLFVIHSNTRTNEHDERLASTDVPDRLMA